MLPPRPCSLLLAVVCGWCLRLGRTLPPVPALPHVSPAAEHPAEDWTYEAQNLWPELFPACGGPRQSPMRLDAELLEFGSRPELSFAPGLANGLVHATNNGHTLKLQLSTEAGMDAGVGTNSAGTGAVTDGKSTPLVTLSAYNSPLSGTYLLEQLHFHWGDARGTAGSEHELGGHRTDAEAHFVFFNSAYGSSVAASRRPDGLAVLAVLLQARQTSPPPDQQLTWPLLGLQGRLSSRLAEVGSRLTVPADLTPLQPLLRQAVGRVFSYRGSLTTPPCSPVVSWLVAAQPVPVDGTFIAELRSSLYRDRARRHLLQNNRRRLQRRRDRLVIKHVSFN